MVPDLLDRLGGERSWPAGELGDGFGPVDDDVADGELGEEGQAVGIGEAQCPADLDRRLVRAALKGVAYVADLALEAVDELGLVAAVDEDVRIVVELG